MPSNNQLVIKDPSELTRAELETLVRDIQILLFLEQDDTSGEEFWDPDKEHDHQMLDAIVASLNNLGMKPKIKGTDK